MSKYKKNELVYHGQLADLICCVKKDLLAETTGKNYVANMNQEGADDPVASILVDNLGSTTASILWERASVGMYTGTLVGAFPAGKTWTMISGTKGNDIGHLKIYRQDDDTIHIETLDDTGVASDDILVNTSIEIRVY